MKKLTGLMGGMLACLFILPAIGVAQEEATMSAEFNHENGRLVVTRTLDSKPSKKCTDTLGAVIYYDDEDSGVTKSLGKLATGKKTSAKVTFTGLLGIKQSDTEANAVICVQSRVKCGKSVNLLSSVDCEYVACGKGTKATTISKFFSVLKEKILSLNQ